MIAYGSPQITWLQVAHHLKAKPAGTLFRLEKHQAQHPRDGGLHPSFGLPVGQRADYRLGYPKCGGLHVRDYGTYYVAHLDRVNPNCDPMGHILQDTPNLAGGAALGALVGLFIGRTKEALLAGAALGAILGLAASVETTTTRRT
jgi:hypothetical protein